MTVCVKSGDLKVVCIKFQHEKKSLSLVVGFDGLQHSIKIIKLRELMFDPFPVPQIVFNLTRILINLLISLMMCFFTSGLYLLVNQATVFPCTQAQISQYVQLQWMPLAEHRGLNR